MMDPTTWNMVFAFEENILQQIVALTEDFPAPSAVLARILSLTSDPEASVEEVAKVLSSEPALAAKILKLSNSAYYGRSRNIATVRDAVVMLGMHTVRSMAVATSTHGLYHHGAESAHLREKMWEHSLSAAIYTKRLAARGTGVNPEEAFLAGLLHDVGKLVLLDRFPEKFAAVVSGSEVTGASALEAEVKQFGFSHANVGAMLLNKWLFPPHLVETAGMHHTEINGNPFTELVHFADAYVTLHGHNLHQPSDREEALIAEQELEKFGVDFEQEYEEYAALFRSL